MTYPTNASELNGANHLVLRHEDASGYGSIAAQPSRSRLLKDHSGNVPLPDGTEGTFRYERLGPACHRFDFRHCNGSPLSRQYLTKPLGNSTPDIEAKARDLASAAFMEAMENERRDYFARVTEPTDGSRRKDTSRYCLDAAKAKEYGGKYSLCMPLGNGRLIRVSSVVDTFEKITGMWRTRKNTHFVIACCNRLDRRWETLRLNPLHAEGHPRPAEASDGV